MVLPSLAIALLSFVIPYGIAFKLVAISGVVTLPVAAWAFGRLTRLPFPTPPLLAVAATVFLFDRSFSIYGGNIASTLAGEFAFSISLSFAVLYLGVVRSRRSRRASTAVGRRYCSRLTGAVPPHPAVLRHRRHRRVVRCSTSSWGEVWLWLSAAFLGLGSRAC